MPPALNCFVKLNDARSNKKVASTHINRALKLLSRTINHKLDNIYLNYYYIVKRSALALGAKWGVEVFDKAGPPEVGKEVLCGMNDYPSCFLQGKIEIVFGITRVSPLERRLLLCLSPNELLVPPTLMCLQLSWRSLYHHHPFHKFTHLFNDTPQSPRTGFLTTSLMISLPYTTHLLLCFCQAFKLITRKSLHYSLWVWLHVC